MRVPSSFVWSIEPNAARQILQFRPLMILEAAMPGENDPQVAGGIAVISIVGPMMKDIKWRGFADTRAIGESVKRAAADDNVRAIVLRIDSPGGSVDGLAELGDAVWAARTVKPVLAQVDGMAAWAAYYVASQASRIVAGRGDMIGSIGVRIMLYDFSKMYEEAGVKALPIDSSPDDRPFKSAAMEGTEITEQHQADFQRIVDTYFADFGRMVQRGRGMSSEAFDAVADGRVWVGEEARAVGLIDGIGTLADTLGALAGSLAVTDRARARR
jgi:capsid assembly protease